MTLSLSAEAPQAGTVPWALEEALQLISHKDAWGQGNYGFLKQTSTGKLIAAPDPTDPRCVTWCAVGGLMKVTGTTFGTNSMKKTLFDESYTILKDAGVEMGYLFPSSLNDHTDLKTVQKMYQRALEIAEERGQS